MKLEDLINEAKAKDPEFKRKIEYRIHGRKNPKPPTLEWLMPELERILGAKYVREAAQAYVDSLVKEADGHPVDQPEGLKTSPEKSEQTLA